MQTQAASHSIMQLAQHPIMNLLKDGGRKEGRRDAGGRKGGLGIHHSAQTPNSEHVSRF